MKTLVIIPAHNEAENIETVVDNLIADFPQYDYVVIDDGSTDLTGSICRRRGYHLISLPVNLGLTGAFQTGMLYAFRHGYDYAVQLDGDNQHDPKYIEAMLKAASEKRCDIVIGSRFRMEKKPHSLRMAGSALITLAIWLTTGKTVKDPTSGMRLYNRKMIARFARTFDYSPEPDTISYLIRQGCGVAEVQVNMRERTAGTSYLTMARSILYMLHMAVSIMILQPFRGGKQK